MAVIALEWPSLGREAGGEGRYARRLCARLADHVELAVVTGPEPVPVRGVKLVPVAASHTQRFDRFYRAPFRAADAVRALTPDVVHAHQDDWPLALDPSWKLPIVRTYHGRTWPKPGPVGPCGAQTTTSWLVSRRPFDATTGQRSGSAPTVSTHSGATTSYHRFSWPAIGHPSKASEPLGVFVRAFETRKRGCLAPQGRRSSPPDPSGSALRHGGPSARPIAVPPVCGVPRLPRRGRRRAGPHRRGVGPAGALHLRAVRIPAWEAMAAGTAVVATANPGIEYLTAGTGCCTVVEPQHFGDALVHLVSSEAALVSQVGRALARALEVAELGRPERYVALFRSVATG
ncbi:MAG: glycosyltransferase [Actinobacteria bacterium]|nr:glycosyltransferase [Actinomycetota bacterium]